VIDAILIRISLKLALSNRFNLNYGKEVESMKVLGTYTLLAIGTLLWVFTQTQAVLCAQQTGLSYPAYTPEPVDLGPLMTRPGSTSISVTLALRLRSANEAEALMTALHTPGNSQFHRFLTASEFAARFAPSTADVAKVISQLAAYKLTGKQTSATTLRVTGSPADMERAFAVSLHAYQDPAHGNVRADTFHAPLGHPSIPSEMTGAVATVVGLNSRPGFRPHFRTLPDRMRATRHAVQSAVTGNPPGFLTVEDFANLYHVQPLYQQGFTGQGRTVGIVTLASFTPSDVFAYWKAVGLNVDPHRVEIIDVDGGPGAPGDLTGSFETTLDVEQSGGIAPGARILVYQAPNSGQGFVDAFATAVDSNSADSLSTSWGFWEWFEDISSVSDPITSQSAEVLQVFHELFLRAAIQGQTLFASSGDAGAYDLNGNLGCNPEAKLTCNLTLSVDDPASDPAITAAGGTTLPGLQKFCLNANCTVSYQVNIPNERVWGWDYLNGLCAKVGVPDPIACGTFPAGSGGGISVLFERPDYQQSLPGLRHSEHGQSYVIDGKFVFGLPGNYVGRNVPDISFNSDPLTGYQVYYTSDTFGFGISPFSGGTSFVAPQLNGVAALLGQVVKGRIGLLNYPLYDLAHALKGYKGSQPSLHGITDGDNWFYYGRNGYSEATGLGTLDVANFAAYLRGLTP
jgi:kumamolisin